MGARFGKYGDQKRLQVLRYGRRTTLAMGSNYRVTASLGRRRVPASISVAAGASLAKTYKTAVVVIPPRDLWEPIQGLRERYDRHYRRWMPHITLLYPFRPLPAFDKVVPGLTRACASVAPFEVRLARFDALIHSRRSATVHLVPEPVEELKQLQTALWEVVPDCDDLRRFSGGFRPHLSVGQARARASRRWSAAWQATWAPAAFKLDRVCLIWRGDPPDDQFRVAAVLPLG